MKYPVLVYKTKGDSNLYSFLEERVFKSTSRELLKSGVFNDIVIIDSEGLKYEIYDIREVGWGNAFMGISLTRKGRQIKIDFEIKLIGRIELDELKAFVLSHPSTMTVLYSETKEMIVKSQSIENVISCFL